MLNTSDQHRTNIISEEGESFCQNSLSIFIQKYFPEKKAHNKLDFHGDISIEQMFIELLQ